MRELKMSWRRGVLKIFNMVEICKQGHAADHHSLASGA
jgi:hypothetical protein